MERPKNMILECVAGSHLYGLNTPSSDFDKRGIYLEDVRDVLNINGRQNGEISDDKQDIKYYSLGKFVKLASECNPNIIELLWVPKKAILYKSPLYDELVSHRDWFMSKRALYTFKGYAYAQIQRAKGLNKKGNSVSKYVNEDGIRMLRMLLNQPSNLSTRMPQNELNKMWIQQHYGSDFLAYLQKETVAWNPDDPLMKSDVIDWDKATDGSCLLFLSEELKSMLPPTFKDFVYSYRRDHNGFPFRPRAFDDDFDKYDISKVEGIPNVYRLYRKGNGFFDEQAMNLRFASISREREIDDWEGVVSVDIDGYTRARKEYASFWEWMNKRNEARYTNDWDSEGKVDWKNIMHTMRLLICAKSIAKTGVPKIRFNGRQREYLLNIRNGRYSYERILRRADKMMAEMDGMFEKSALPHSSNFNAINDWYCEKMEQQVLDKYKVK